MCFSRGAAPLLFVVLPLPTSHCDWTTGRSGTPEHVTSEICLLKLRSSYAANVVVFCRPRHRPSTVLKFSPEKHNLWLSPEITSARRAALPLVAAVLVALGVCIIKNRLYSVRSSLVR